MKHQIKHRYTEAVLFECDLPDDTPSGLAMRHALERADLAGANLTGANLAGAYLTGADLDGANLTGANLAGANLAGADLDGANLTGADLAGANLAGANLAGANLDGAYLARANLDGANLARANLAGAYLDHKTKLVGDRPIFMIGPIGSRNSYFTAFITDQGLLVTAGCFRQKTIEEFRAKLEDEHGDNDHAKEYEAALMLVAVHAEIWTPKKEVQS